MPVVTLDDEDVPLASEIATGVATRLGGELNLPVFLYGALATDPAHALPRDFRREGLEELGRAVEEGRLVPDHGPPRLHPTAGAALVGVRPPLIALNVWLPDASLTDARAIAARVREAGGGPPGVRALGLYLPEAGMAQVSMNLEDHRQAPPAAAIAAVRAAAESLGVESGEAELVGLAPRAALRGPSPSALGIRGMRPGPDPRAPGPRPRPGPRLGRAVAKRKRRKSAGPPPVHNPRRAALEASGEAPAKDAPKRRQGEPAPPSFKGVALRAGIVAAVFYPYLIYIVGEDPGPSLLITRPRLRADAAAGDAARPLALPAPDAQVGGAAGGPAVEPVSEAGRRASAPRGTRDVLPAEARVRERVIDVARDAFARYGYGEIVTPTFEETEVFVRGVGTSTDVVREGDVHLRGPRRPLPDAAPRGHGAGGPGLRRSTACTSCRCR